MLRSCVISEPQVAANGTGKRNGSHQCLMLPCLGRSNISDVKNTTVFTFFEENQSTNVQLVVCADIGYVS